MLTLVNVKDAGEGTLEIGICGPSGQNVSNTVTSLGPGHFVVSYIPLESGPHRTNVTFNGESVNGNPFVFLVNDPGRVVARGEGLNLIRCGQSTAFAITAPGAQLKDLDIRITAPNNRDILPRISETGANNFKVGYTPTVAGDYMIDITCFDQTITGSPFFAHASDISRVMVSNITTGIVGQQSSFSIDVKNAGDCTLEISISGPSGQIVSNNVDAQSPGLFLVTFVPVESGQHRANVTFNKECVRGNPFMFMVIDPMKVTARGDGLALVRCNQMTSFVITAPAAQLTDLEVTITGPNGKQIAQRMSDGGTNSYKVDYTPVVAGDHQIEILYFGQPIPASPFVAKVWDSSKVIVSPITSGCVGNPATFSIDVKDAGEGTLEIGINGSSGQNIPNNVVSLGPAQFEVTYTPLESGMHRANITFNKENVFGSPFQFLVTDSGRVMVRGDGIGLVKVNQIASFMLTAPAAQLKDVEITITGPNNKAIIPTVVEQGTNVFKCDYTPPLAGDYKVDVSYFGQPIPGSPFAAKAWDQSKVVVSNIAASYVGTQTSFNIDARDAGDGTMEINIVGPAGRNVANSVSQHGPGRFEVSFVPTDCGQHYASVTFNKETVPGSRFQFLVTDPAKAGARGDGLGTVRCNQQTQFSVTAPGAQLNNIIVQIIGPDDKDVLARVTETSASDVFLVEYLPVLVGHYTISVSYFNQAVCGSPFTAKAWNASAITVTGVKACCIGKQCTINVNTSRAGDGHLEVVLSSCGEIIPHTAKNLGNGTFDIMFSPQKADIHLVIVKFNSEMIPGSPFSIPVIDGSKATATGEGVTGCSIIANKQTSFEVNTKMVSGEAPLDVSITSPRGQKLIPKITGSANTCYCVEYLPVEAGRYVVDVKYAEMPIMGSPFYPEVFDPYQVRVCRLPVGFIGKPVLFDVDASTAGEGRLAVDVRGQITRPLVDISQKSTGMYTVSFTPQESVEHTALVTFNSIPVPGSPFACCVIDVSGLCAKWDCIRMKPVHQPVVVELDPKQSPDADVTCVVTDPQGTNLVTKMSRTGRLYKAEFTGHTVGEYHVDLRYGGVPVPGSPFACNLYDTKRVHVTEACTTGNVGQPSSFAVDISGAGLGGDLDVDVLSNDIRIPTQIQNLGVYKQRYTFVPMSPCDHVICVKYNDEHVPGSPMLVRIMNPAGQMSLCGINGAAKLVPVGQVVSAVVSTQGVTINPADLAVKVTAPDGEILVHRVTALRDNNFQVEYTARLTGVHRIDAQYAGHTIHGSPFVVEFFDPSKILVEGTRTGMAGEPMILDVLSKDAGKGDLLVSVKNFHGGNVSCEVQPTPRGYQVRYIPTEPGTYLTHMSYGGIDVPGCPISQQIEECFLPTASGCGLVNARENMAASFTVNSSGRCGELKVTVEGPNSIARCAVEQEQGGTYKITYTPVEVGIYNVTICWNGRTIPGCPFKPKVCNPDKLMVVGGWQNFLLVDNKMQLELNKTKRIEFDSAPAGPGELGVEVSGPQGPVPVDITQRESDRYIASFHPSCPGYYTMKVYWCQQLLQRCPIIGTVAEPPKPLLPQPCPTIPVPIWDVNDIVLIGAGLTNARVQEMADFIVDGCRAGPGEPIVKLMGLKCDIEVRCEQVAPGRYQCCYTPELPGAYLLSVSWGACQVPGSPFKVTVASGSDSSKVSVSGPGLAGGMSGQELEFSIDTRRAGTGELSATCRGPTKPAFCKLEDQRNGTFTLLVTPQEMGNHQLKVTFSGETIPGSPFMFNVGTAADASKVRVTGPGIQSGILATFQSTLLVETRGAGPGRLTVKVRGPKGAFRVEMAKDPDRDRAIVCRYNPTEVGQYLLHVQWSGDHVPGSPFPVTIVDTLQELEMLSGRSALASIDNNIDRMTFAGNSNELHWCGGGTSGRSGSVLSGFGGGRYGDGMSTLNGDGLVFGDDN